MYGIINYFGRDVLLLKKISEESVMYIIANTDLYELVKVAKGKAEFAIQVHTGNKPTGGH